MQQGHVVERHRSGYNSEQQFKSAKRPNIERDILIRGSKALSLLPSACGQKQDSMTRGTPFIKALNSPPSASGFQDAVAHAWQFSVVHRTGETKAFQSIIWPAQPRMRKTGHLAHNPRMEVSSQIPSGTRTHLARSGGYMLHMDDRRVIPGLRSPSKKPESSTTATRATILSPPMDSLVYASVFETQNSQRSRAVQEDQLRLRNCEGRDLYTSVQLEGTEAVGNKTSFSWRTNVYCQSPRALVAVWLLSKRKENVLGVDTPSNSLLPRIGGWIWRLDLELKTDLEMDLDLDLDL